MKLMIPAAIRSDRLALLARYSAVSAVSTASSITVLGLLVWSAGMGASVANVVATLVGTVPSFELNRRWVWCHQAKRSIIRQVAPFVTLSIMGLLLSTLAVHVAAIYTADWSRALHTMAVEAANICAYGSLWAIQFVLLDRVLFARRRVTRTLAASTVPASVVSDRGHSS